MAIKTFKIETCMGKVMKYFTHPLPFLSEEEKKEFDLIGYSGENSKGEKTNRMAYLNSLNLGEFAISQIKWDDGDFCEEFLIIQVVK